MEADRKETARLRRRLRREEDRRVEGEMLEKRRKTAAEDKAKHDAKRDTAMATLELKRGEQQLAETIVLSLSWDRFGWGGGGGHQSQITCAGFQPNPWGIRVSNHM